MKTTMYLYGVNAIDFADLAYDEALIFKAKAAKKTMRKVGQEAAKVIGDPCLYLPLLEQYQACNRALLFNRRLLEELK